MTAKVSILIPVYNREDLISECIQSALDQTFRDFEVIVVDNKSEDRTFEICQDFAKRDPRVKVFQNGTNIGPVRNWLACADKAAGEFCKILFSDDALMGTCLEKMVPRLEDLDVAFVLSAARIGASIADSRVSYDLGSDKDIVPNQFVKLALRAKVPWTPGAVLLRTEDLKRNLKTGFPTATPQPFDQHGAGPDVMIMLLTSRSYPRVAIVSDPEVFLRSHPGSFTVNDTGGRVQDGYQAAFSYFLRGSAGYLAWMKYVSLLWVQTVGREKRPVNLRAFLSGYEGTGRMSEAVLAFFVAIWAALESTLLRQGARGQRLLRRIFG
jgi:glycosyltransferase involved in cell wall biosynthesis